MTHTRLIRVAAACTVGTVAAVVVAGSTAADPPPRHDFTAAAVAIPVAPGTNADDDAIRFATAHGRSAKIDGVATSSLSCDGCSAHAFTVQIVYAPRTRVVIADNVATAWASQCAGCSGWAVSLQIVVARSAGAVTAANRALSFTTVCDNCSVRAAAVQIVVIAPSDRQLTPRQLDSLEALYERFAGALTPAASPSTTGARAAQATPNRTATTITATTEQIQAVVADSLGAISATHSVAVR
ncbi:MAG TPA: hypothetical protein VGJ59_11195 [Jatrophihabitantaceae bacterium]